MTREEVYQQIAETGFELSPEDQAFVYGLVRTSGWSTKRIVPVVDAIRRGVTPEEYSGIKPEQLERLEAHATNLYADKEYEAAYAVFRGVCSLKERLGRSSATATRGMAACNHAQGYLLDAIDQYTDALRLDPDDLISRVALARALCATGQISRGLDIAREVVRTKKKLRQPKLVAEAQTLLDANGGALMLELSRRRPSSNLVQTSSTLAATQVAQEMFDVLRRIDTEGRR